MKFSSKKIRKFFKERKGFTLIETVVTVAIIAVLTGIAAVGVYGYLSSAYTTKVSETARTIFYASQSYLLEQKQMGKLESFNQSAQAYGDKIPWDDLKEILRLNRGANFDEEDYKDNYATDTTRYILMEKGSPDTNPLYQIVKAATNDTGLLKHTFLLEYDEKTGVVRSVFYSEKTERFAYERTDSAMKAKNNVILRNPDSVHEKRQGYFGVDITGKKAASEIFLMEAANVTLFNGERLYLQWTDKNQSNPEFAMRPELAENLLYDITVYRQTEDLPEALIQFNDVGVEDITSAITLDSADDKVLTKENYRLAYSRSMAEKTSTYQLLLDDIHHSIFQTYTGKNTELPTNITIEKDVKAEDILFCEITVKLNKTATGLDATSLPSASNLQSSAFGGGTKEVTWINSGGVEEKVETNASGILEDGTQNKSFSVWNTRHLENIRYGQNIAEHAYFTQNTTIDWTKPEGRTGKEVPYRSIIYYGAALSETPFVGNYTVLKDSANRYFPILNLSINQQGVSKVGFISQNMGTISGLTLDKPKVSGSLLTGIVAGVNGGIIEHITISNGNVMGSHLLGGVTGYNTAAGTVEDINALVKMDGMAVLNQEVKIPEIETFSANTKGRYIGGLIGLNKGKARNLTTQKSSVTGTSYVGGIFGGNLAAKAVTIDIVKNRNDVNLASDVTASEKLEYFGGIVGYQGESTLKEAANYGLLSIPKIASITDADRLQHVGGIAGFNDGTLATCTNEAGTDNLTAIQNNCLDQIKKGTLPSYLGKYVGGIAGTNTGNGKIQKCYNKNGVVLGNSVVGGFVGNNEGTDISVTKNQPMSGLVIGSEYLVGGIFGYNGGDDVNGYTNQSNVFGKGMVGGIIGFNGKLSGSQGDDEVLVYLNSLEGKTGDSYLSNLLEVENKLPASSSIKIESCENQGFVFTQSYFGGGIAGVNYGSINQSNTVNSVSFSEITQLGNADCVGGIVGFNGTTGNIDGRTNQMVKSNVVANNFVGGIVGLNHGKISGYVQVEGTVYGKGDCVGGMIGLNTNSNAISSLTHNATTTIEGAYFVGGIMGCNVAISSGANTHIKDAKSAQSNITAQAYAGGILGYNAYVDQGISIGNLFGTSGELTLLKQYAYAGDPPAGTLGNRTTIFEGCDSQANVKANRYVGGIIGYNSTRANLWVVSSNNGGLVEILEGSVVEKSSDNATYYYIGGITGRNSQGGVIHKCSNNGSVKSPSTYLGGICEVNEGYVQFCGSGKNEGTGEKFGTEGDNSVGGIVGLNRRSAFVVSCYADSYAKIKGGNRTGGLVGTNENEGIITSNYVGNEAKSISGYVDAGDIPTGEASLSYCNATVIGKEDTGGIVGYNQGSLAHSVVKTSANITGTRNVGGFVGTNAKDASISGKKGTIENLVNHAKVYGNHEVGGIVGKHNATEIKNCENRGEVKAIGNKLGYAGGITGSNDKGVTIINCRNYGLVRSEHSFAGGITGINDGTLRDSQNYGSVQGSFEPTTISTQADGVYGAAIGGVAGCNYRDGNIYDCASKDNGKSGSEKNKIQGNYLVGGIIGYYDRMTSSNGELLNKTSESLEVDITIEPMNQKVEMETESRCRIGGVIGGTDPSPRETVLKDYVFKGIIHIPDEAGKNQQEIGGIIGSQAKNVTLENCMFDGEITGSGNNPTTYSNAGIGGLAGSSTGTILVYSNDQNVYTSNTQNAWVEGAKRVAGVVGETNGSFQVKLKLKDDSVVLLDEVAEKDVYYENNATVKGGMWVGGIYGSMQHDSEKLRNLKNNGLILTKNINGKSSMGGISGAAKVRRIENCLNAGDIGDDKDPNVMQNVGGIVGYCEGRGIDSSNIIEVNNCQNFGSIFAGVKNIGGLFGVLKDAKMSYNCMSLARIKVNQSRVSQVVAVGGIIGVAENVSIVNDSGKLQSMGSIGYYSADISIWGRAYQIGGVIGAVIGNDSTVSIEKIENNVFISEKDTPNGTNYVQTGGFVGNAAGNGLLELKGCENKVNLNMNNAREVGGLIGKSEGRNLKIIDCTNHGEISASEHVAGIVGLMVNSKIDQFKQNKNLGIIKGRISTGGICGYVQNSTGVVEDCINEAPIQILKANGGNVARNIGGCFGTVENISTNSPFSIERVENKGKITIQQSLFSESSQIGGIVGYLFHGRAFVSNSTNSGEIEIIASGSSKNQSSAIGGIAGRVYSQAVIGEYDSQGVRTINTGKILVSGGTKDNIYQVGGIAGLVDSGGRLKYCTNKGDVLAGESSSKDVGGIAGKSSGVIYSCKAEDGVTVEGRSNVGGLVGNASSYASKTTSAGDGKGGYDLSYANASVTGQERVGGIVGYLQEGTIYNVYVDANSVITLNRNDSESKEKSVGGIVGYTGALGNTLEAKGIISSCYNFGEVKDNETGDSKYYVGGVVGYRDHLGGKATARIVDSFNVSSEVGMTVPPKDGLIGSDPDRTAWAVGNEPYVTNGGSGAIYQDPDDKHTYTAIAGTKNPLETADKFLWSEAACNALRLSLGVTSSLPYDSKEAILELMQKYDGFKLQAPELVSVVPGKEFQYTYTLKALPGLYTEYGFKVYDGAHEVGKVKPDTAVETKITSTEGNGKDVLYDFKTKFTLNLETILSKAELNGLVGKTLSVTTYAKGYSLDDLHYSQKSDEVVLLQMVIMPPLPQPVLRSMPPGEAASGEDWFDADGQQVITGLEITNWNEYKKAAAAVYSNLSTVDAAKLYQAGIYDEFVNGLIQFEMTDTFVTSSTAGLSTIKIPHVIKKKDDTNPQKVYYDVSADGSKAYITIDYTGNSTFNSNSGNKPWHAYEIAARIDPTARGITINPLAPEFRYRYTDSNERIGVNFRLKTKLKPPKNITTQYLGSKDPADIAKPISYALKWEKDGGLNETIQGYKVELQSLTITKKGETPVPYTLSDKPFYIGEPYITQVNDVGNTQLVLTKEQIQQIFTDLELIVPPDVYDWWEDESQYTIGYQVTTLSKDEEICITSEKSAVSEFSLIKRQPMVTDLAVEKDALGQNMKITWKDGGTFDLTQPDITETEKKRHKYDVTYSVTCNEAEIQSESKTVEGALEWDGIILSPELAGKSFSVTIEIVKQGEEVTDPIKASLNSNLVNEEIVIGDRLKIPTNFEIRADKIEEVEGEEKLFLHFTWKNDGNTGADGVKPIDVTNCSGYQIDIVVDGKEEEPITEIVLGFGTLEADVVIPLIEGKDVKFNLRALGTAGVEKSDWVSIGYIAASERMAEPEVTKFDPDHTTSYKREDYPYENYEMTIDVKESVELLVAGQKIQVLDGEEILWEGDSTLTKDTGKVQMDFASQEKALDLAGKEITVRISNMSKGIDTKLPSKTADYLFTMPKIKLDTPAAALAKRTITPDPNDTAQNYNVYHAQVEVYGSVSDESIKTEEKADREGQIIQLLNGNTLGDFILMRPMTDGTDGYEPEDGNQINSYEVNKEKQFEFYFRLPEGFSGNEADYKLVVTNLAKTGSDQTKYDDSEDAEAELSGAGALTSIILDLIEMLPEELLPIPEEATTEESTTEEGTTEESTTEEGTTEESTTEEGTTEESTTEEAATEESTTEEAATEGSTTQEATTEESTKEEAATEESTAKENTTEGTTQAATS